MNFLQKLARKSKSSIFLPSIPIRLNPCSVSSPYSTKLPYEPEFPVLSPMEDMNRTLGETREEKKLARPSEIPFQPKVANWLNFVGTVKMPIQFCTAVDGKSWAGTIISWQRHPGSSFHLHWIPVIFEGDLAIIAATHLKEKDIVYVAGHLSPDPLPINLTNDQVNVQVKVHDVYFVRQFPGVKEHFPRS